MNILAVVFQILVLLMIAATGLFLRKKNVLTDPVIKGVNSIVLTVAWPIMILMSTQRDFETISTGSFLRLLLLSTLCMAVLSAILFVAVKKRMPEKRQAVFSGLCALPNAGFVGLPIVQAFYGSAGITYLAAYIVAFNLVMWSMYLLIFDKNVKNPFKAMLNASVIAGVTAVILFVLRIRIPEPFASFFNQLASLTTPLSMLLLGSRLIESLNIKKLRSPTLWGAVCIRLVLFPLAVYALMRLLGLTGMELGVMVLASAMPCASATQMFAEKYDKDYSLAAQGIAISLLLCLVTIPVILLITGV
jgi:Predicted permeases